MNKVTAKRLYNQIRKIDKVLAGRFLDTLPMDYLPFVLPTRFGRGFGRGLGLRRGRGLRRPGPFGLGPGGTCICPECGYTCEHDWGVPCYTITCPNCGSPMTRDVSNL